MKLTTKQLKKIIKEEVATYKEGDTQPSSHRSSGQEQQAYQNIETEIKTAIHLGIGIEDILQRITAYIDNKGYMDPKFD
tara:strand:+ start:5136 stop:5372 length:237 start_codon:yes stop_codon:yes gene_type:complete